MSVVLDGAGTTYTRSGLTLKPKTITIPGWDKPEIDVTTLSNAAYRTFVLGLLKTVHDLQLGGVEFDPAVYGAIPTANGQWTITFPSAAGTAVFWGDVKSLGDPSFDQESGQPVFDITVKITNRNGSGVETGPVFS